MTTKSKCRSATFRVICTHASAFADCRDCGHAKTHEETPICKQGTCNKATVRCLLPNAKHLRDACVEGEKQRRGNA